MIAALTNIDHYNFRTEKPAPGCGHTAGIFTVATPLFTGDGLLILPSRIVGWCNRGDCDQRFYVYPAKGRVTKRNTGESLKERHSRLGHY